MEGAAGSEEEQTRNRHDEGELMDSIETKLNKALGAISIQGQMIAKLKRAIHQKSITIASIQRDARLKESGLPQLAIKRLHEAFATSTDNAGLKEAINVERKRG
jgi:hypothetical protein